MTYQLILSKQLLSLLRQIHVAYRNLPSRVISANLGSERASDDLMPIADSQNLYTLIVYSLFCIFDQFQNPRVVVKRVVLCKNELEMKEKKKKKPRDSNGPSANRIANVELRTKARRMEMRLLTRSGQEDCIDIL